MIIFFKRSECEPIGTCVLIRTNKVVMNKTTLWFVAQQTGQYQFRCTFFLRSKTPQMLHFPGNTRKVYLTGLILPFEAKRKCY